MLALFASLVSPICGQMRLCLIANHLGLASGTAATIGGFLLLSGFRYLPLLGRTTLLAAAKYGNRAYIVLYFLLAEVDRVNCQTEQQEAQALRHQFHGSIRHASCSEVQDEVNIRSEIGDQIDEVDKVIQVLLKAGMTSDALRHASLQGVELCHAGFVQLAIPVLVLGPLLMLGCWLVSRYIYLLHELGHPIANVYTFMASAETASILARLTFLGLLLRRSIDERCFMLNVMAKIVTIFYFCLVELGSLGSKAMFSSLLTLYNFSFILVLFFAALGIRGTLKLLVNTTCQVHVSPANFTTKHVPQKAA